MTLALGIISAERRHIVIVGNCQAGVLADLYRRFVAPRTGETIDHVASYTELTPEARASIQRADLIVEQLFDVRQQTSAADLAATTRRIYFPLVGAGFLWPFAGHAHPRNAAYPWLPGGPYAGETSDTWLNAQIEAGVSVADAVDAYLAADMSRLGNLDRMYELIMDFQRDRDDASDYRIADVIEAHFRTEHIFLTPHHPNLRIALSLCVQLFRQMGATQSDIDLINNRIKINPFGEGALPIHPGVARHFGLTYAHPDYRYRFMSEGRFTFREFAERYMRFEWNPALEEGMVLMHSGSHDAAMDLLLTGVMQSPNSSVGYYAISHILSLSNDVDGALAAAQRAVAIEPDNAWARSALGGLLLRAGKAMEAEQQLRMALEAQPFEPHFYVLLAHMLRLRRAIPEAIDLLQQAQRLDPYSEPIRAELAGLLGSAG